MQNVRWHVDPDWNMLKRSRNSVEERLSSKAWLKKRFENANFPISLMASSNLKPWLPEG